MAAIVLDKIRDDGVVIHEGSKVTSVENLPDNKVRVHVENEEGSTSIIGDNILVATGRAVPLRGWIWKEPEWNTQGAE